jgi:hypothetical protein
MKPNDNVPLSRPDQPGPPCYGDLVVRNGRLKGVRRALASPLTLMGQAPLCEVRLHVEGINPIHCVLALGPGGVTLRDLGSESGTLVNGERVSQHLLKHGDVIHIGPFQFVYELPEGLPAESLWPDQSGMQAERDALRVQAAAVAAQQAGLTEEELKLEQRRVALKRQEEQLSRHLEERRNKLQQLQHQIKEEKAQLHAAHVEEEKWQTESRDGITRVRGELDQALKQSHKERQRCVELRKRLKKRWKRHWQAAEAAMQQRGQQMQTEQQRLHKEAEALQREREVFRDSRLRYNGDMELGRRQLQDAWQELNKEKQRWQETQAQQQKELRQQSQAVDTRVAALVAGERRLAEQQQHWQHRQATLVKDVDGLENRLRNQRHKLEQEAQAVPGTTQPAAPTLPDAPAPQPEIRTPVPVAPEALSTLAGELADQRSHLAEQWQRVLELQDGWHKERSQLAGELEEAAQRLRTQEERLEERQQQILAQEETLSQRAQQLQERQEELSRLRCSLEARQARLTAQGGAWEREHTQIVADVQGRERIAAARVQRCVEVDQRRARRVRHEIEQLLAGQKRCAEVRQQYLVLWKECQERRAGLTQEQQAAATEALALERLREETLSQVEDGPAAEKRLERLRRQSRAVLLRAEQELEKANQELLVEHRQLDLRGKEMDKREAGAINLAWEREREQTQWEQQQLAYQEEEQQRKQELARLQLEHQRDTRQVRELNEEVERIARLLIEEGGEQHTPPTNQAA